MIFRVRIDVIASTSTLIYFSKTPKGHLGKEGIDGVDILFARE
jgi:hypothetical protein